MSNISNLIPLNPETSSVVDPTDTEIALLKQTMEKLTEEYLKTRRQMQQQLDDALKQPQNLSSRVTPHSVDSPSNPKPLVGSTFSRKAEQDCRNIPPNSFENSRYMWMGVPAKSGEFFFIPRP